MKYTKELTIRIDLETKKMEYDANKAISKLEGYLLNSDFKECFNKIIILKEIMHSNKIEEIHTTYINLLSMCAFKNQNGTEDDITTFKNIEAINFGINYINKNGYIDKKLLIEIQKIIRGVNEDIRKVPNTIKNSKNEIIYKPPSTYEQIINLLNELENYINYDYEINSYSNIIKMVIMHFQFESIHPFSDGNGRTGRILNILFLIFKKEIEYPIFTLSYYIAKSKKRYYKLLNNSNKDETYLEELIKYFLSIFIESSKDSMKILDYLKMVFSSINFNNTKLDNNKLKELFNLVYFQTNDLISLFNISFNTAKKYLSNWINENIIIEIKTKNKQNKYYIFKGLLDFINSME